MLFFMFLLLSVGVVQSLDYESLFEEDEVVVTQSGYTIEESCAGNKKCVPYHKCQNTDGRGIFNIRGEFQKVECESLEICCDTHDIDQSGLPDMDIHKKCGQANPNGLGPRPKVITNFTQFGEFPWMMALVKKEIRGTEEMNVYIAGGTLIHPKVVLTTAHNIQNFRNATIVARGGEWNTQSTEEMLKHQDRPVVKIVSHPDFVRANLQNDLALLFLDTPFTLAPHINIACLPKNNFLRDGCISTGWGKNEFGRAGTYQVFLKKVELPLVDNEDCESMLRQTRLGEDFVLHDGFMCAGGKEGVDTCTGDGGGPLVCPIDGEDNRYALVGIVVGGIGCNRANHPGFYVDVGKYKTWIQDEISKEIKGIKLQNIG